MTVKLFNSFFVKDGKKYFIGIPNDLMLSANNISLSRDFYSVFDDIFINTLDESQDFCLVQLAFDHINKKTKEKHKRCCLLVKTEDNIPISVTFDLTFDCWNKALILNDDALPIGKIADYEEVRGEK